MFFTGHEGDDENDDFTLDPNSGQRVPDPCYRSPKRGALVDTTKEMRETPNGQGLAFSPLVTTEDRPSFTSLQRNQSREVREDAGASHPMYVTNPERARLRGFHQVAEEGELARLSRSSMPPPQSPPMKRKSQAYPAPQPQLPPPLPHVQGIAAIGKTASFLRQSSQVSSPTQTQQTGLSGEGAAGGGRGKKAATKKPITGAAFQLSGVGATVSSSVGRRVSLLVVEALGATRYQLLPDPRRDPLLGVAWRLSDTFGFDSETEETHRAAGVLVNASYPCDGEAAPELPPGCEASSPPSSSSSSPPLSPQLPSPPPSWQRSLGPGVVEVEVLPSERATLLALESIFARFDPDVVAGWDMERASLKWLIRRGEALDEPLDMARRLSRAPGEPRSDKHGNDEWGAATTSDVHLTGRVVLALWRVMRSELKLCSYTLENVAAKVLNRRLPQVQPYLRRAWWASGAAGRARALRLELDRTEAQVAILEKLDLLNRFSESARL